MNRAGERRIHRPPTEMPIGAPMSAKLFAPRLRTANVPRTRILERLSTFRGVVLVSAPPGFGKTTLLAQWQRSDVRPFGWLTLDQSDNDPVVLWTYMKLAVESLLPQGGEASASSRPSRADPDVVVPELLSALEGLGVDVVLVLEDLHSITDPASLALLTQFLEGQPPNVTLALSARSDLYLPLGDLRVRLDLLELRATDLAFDIAEAERFLNGALDLALTSSAIDWLWNRTEGWPAGLYLAYLSLRESADPEAFVSRFQGSSRRIVEYLAEILDGQDARTRDFLVGSSILERMSGPLCDHVLATEGSAEVLESLERANLFVVSLD